MKNSISQRMRGTLAVSVLSMVLSVCLCVGSTYAPFSDELGREHTIVIGYFDATATVGNIGLSSSDTIFSAGDYQLSVHMEGSTSGCALLCLDALQSDTPTQIYCIGPLNCTGQPNDDGLYAKDVPCKLVLEEETAIRFVPVWGRAQQGTLLEDGACLMYGEQQEEEQQEEEQQEEEQQEEEQQESVDTATGESKDTPAVDSGKDIPAADSEKDTPAADSGKDTPAADSGKDTPAADSGKDTPAADSGASTPSSGDTGGAPSSGDAGGTSSSGNAGDTSSSDDAGDTPSGSTDSTPSGSTDSTPSGSTDSTPSGSTDSTLSSSTSGAPSSGNTGGTSDTGETPE